jgi:acyl carrier protein
MVTTRQTIVQLIEANLPFGNDTPGEIDEASVLADLGVDSLHLITMLLELQRQHFFDVGIVTQQGMPVTVGDLVSMVERGQAARSEDTL